MLFWKYAAYINGLCDGTRQHGGAVHHHARTHRWQKSINMRQKYHGRTRTNSALQLRNETQRNVYPHKRLGDEDASKSIVKNRVTEWQESRTILSGTRFGG
jgi:hypothetical protein